MREKESAKDIRETIKKWTRLGRKVEMIDMPAIKSPEDRRKMKALFDSLVNWRRSKAFTDISGEVESVTKDIQLGMKWWKKDGGKKFDVQNAMGEVAPKMDAVRNVERCLGWLHDPDGKKDFDTLAIDDLPQKEVYKQVLKLVEQLSWYREEGQSVSKKEVANEVKIGQTQRIAQWWSHYGKPLDARRARDASEKMIEMLKWLRTNKDHLDDPLIVAKFEKLFSVWAPNQKIKLTDNKIPKDIDEALRWWRNTGYKCDPAKVGGASRSKLVQLLELAKTIESSDSDAFKGDEDVLAWTKGPKDDVRDLPDVMSDIMDCFGVTNTPGLPKIKEDDDDDEDDDESEGAIEQALGMIRGALGDQDLFGMTKTLSAEEERAQEMEKALDWLKANDTDFDNADLGDDEGSVAAMSLISEILPNAETMAAKEVASAMESALDWLRSNDAAADFNVD